MTAFFATDGAFTPGRVVLDTTGDGRPNDERFATRWLPPTLDPCEEADDPCSFGTCDPTLRLCTGEVDIWLVARDGRVIGRGFNQREKLQDPTAHAEMIALTAAAEHVGHWE